MDNTNTDTSPELKPKPRNKREFNSPRGKIAVKHPRSHPGGIVQFTDGTVHQLTQKGNVLLAVDPADGALKKPLKLNKKQRRKARKEQNED